MAIVVETDYLYAPRITRTGGAGIISGVLVATKNYLFVIPFDRIGGAGHGVVK